MGETKDAHHEVPTTGQKSNVWKSPLMDPLQEVLSSLPESSSMIIPESGWHGLFFSCVISQENKTQLGEEGNEENAEEDNDLDRNQRREVKAGYATTLGSRRNVVQEQQQHQQQQPSMPQGLENWEFSLLIQTTIKEGDDNHPSSQTGIIKLDLPRDGNTIAMNVGRLYYLPAKSRVAIVIQKSIRNIAETKTTMVQSESEERIASNLKWFLSYRRSISRDISKEIIINRGDATGNAAGDVADSSCCKKPIMCGACWKRFATVKQALDHWKQKHSKPGKGEELQEQAGAITKRGFYHNCETNFPKSLTVVYQDNHMAVIDKPQGVAVQGDKPSLMRSDLLLSLAHVVVDDKKTATTDSGASDCNSSPSSPEPPPEPQPQYLKKPVPCHRLDAGTGGLLVLAKTKEADRYLKGCFAKRRCKKRYRALVLGKLQPMEGLVDLPLSDQPAKTRYQVLNHHRSTYGNDGYITKVDLFPETGRKHQLRKHMKSLGHSIIGDRRYNGCIQLQGDKQEQQSAHDNDDNDDEPSSVMSRLCLWAMELALPHPETRKEVTFHIDEPEWLRHVIEKSAPKDS